MLRKDQNLKSRGTFLKRCSILASEIEDNKAELVKFLSSYETQDAAHDEIERSIATLHGLEREIGDIQRPFNDLNISTFFPLNLPLYSLILFGIAPSIFAKNIFIRPPEVMHELLTQLWEMLGIDELFPVISLKPTPRHIFVQLYAMESDVIVFTGKYENALDIHRKCPHALLVYNGSGINPFLLFRNADVGLAVEKAVEMRCFNSGQDCAGPDAFFVPTNLVSEFIEKLKLRLDVVKVGDTTDSQVNVGKTMKQSYINELRKWFKHEEDHLVYGGEIDLERQLVFPSIIHKKIDAHTKEDFHEFFAPYFYILEYDDDKKLENILLSEKFKERGMYISVFGDNPAIEKKLDFVQLLKNIIVNDVERGNMQYGGFGNHANFLLYGDQKIVHPVLISRDVHAVLAN